MKDDFSKDETTFSNKDQSGNSSSDNDDSLDWAKQAYLQLKQKQKITLELEKVLSVQLEDKLWQQRKYLRKE